MNGGLQDNWSLFSYDKYKTFRDGTHGFTELAAFQAGRGLMGVRRNSSNQPAESLRTQYVSGNYFSMFGIGAYAGRMFTQADDRQGAEPVVVMSYATWQQKYGQDPSVIGASFTFNGSAVYRDRSCAAKILRRPDGGRACILDSAECRGGDR